jgi:transposase
MKKNQMQILLSGDKPVNVEYVKIRKKPKVVFKTYSKSQEFLLPKNIEEMIPYGHISRLIDAIINQMELKEIYEKYKGGGASAYDPKMLLKVWVVGFLNRIYTSRPIAKALRENVVFMWISGKQKPDFRTLSGFRKSLGKEIKQIFKEIVKYGISVGIISGKDIFIDHTKIEANANKHKIVWKKQVEKRQKSIDEEIDQLFDYVDKVNDEEDKVFGNHDLPEQERKGFDKDKVKEIVEKINKRIRDEKTSHQKGAEIKKKVRRIGELTIKKEEYKKKKEILGERNSYSRTDIDAVAMMMKDKKSIKPGYNEGVSVENGFVVDFVISDNCGDSKSFVPLMNGTIDNLGKTPETATSDSAYGNEEDHAYLEDRKIGNYLKYNLYHKEKSKKWQEAKLRFNDFNYNKEKDEFTCKNNVKLVFEKEFEDITKTGFVKRMKKYIAQEGQCMNCPFKQKCTEGKARSISVSWNAERLKETARQNLNSDKGKELRKRRGNEVESVFGDKKLNNKMPRFILRGMEKVKIEAGIYFITHNIKKIQEYVNKKARNFEENDKNNQKIPSQNIISTCLQIFIKKILRI